MKKALHRVLGLLLPIYVGMAIVLYLPWQEPGRARLRFAVDALMRFVPAFALAYVIMIAGWPWAAQAPLNPVRGLIAQGDLVNVVPQASVPVQLYWHCWNLESAVLDQLTSALTRDAGEALRPA